MPGNNGSFNDKNDPAGQVNAQTDTEGVRIQTHQSWTAHELGYITSQWGILLA